MLGQRPALDRTAEQDLQNLQPENNLQAIWQQAMRAHQIPRKQVVVRDRIGSGGFGVVHKGDFLGASVAVKILKGLKDQVQDKSLLDFEKEVGVWQGVSHPNIVTLHGVIIDEQDDPAIVMEYCPRGNLHTCFRDRPPESVSLRQRVHWLRCAASGLEYLHACDVVHGDIKSLNVLITNDSLQEGLLSCKIADFGLSEVQAVSVSKRSARPSPEEKSSSGSGGGTPAFMAPELWEGERNTKMSDVYAFGMLVFEVLAGEFPLWHMRPDILSVAVRANNVRPKRPTGAYVDSWPAAAYDALWSLACRCWDAAPSCRLSMKDARYLLDKIASMLVADSALAATVATADSVPPMLSCLPSPTAATASGGSIGEMPSLSPATTGSGPFDSDRGVDLPKMSSLAVSLAASTGPSCSAPATPATSAEESLQKSRCLLHGGQLEEALRLLHDAVGEHPTRGDLHSALADACTNVPLPFTAAKAARRAVELAGSNEDYRLLLARVFLKTGRFEECERELQLCSGARAQSLQQKCRSFKQSYAEFLHVVGEGRAVDSLLDRFEVLKDDLPWSWELCERAVKALIGRQHIEAASKILASWSWMSEEEDCPEKRGFIALTGKVRYMAGDFAAAVTALVVLKQFASDHPVVQEYLSKAQQMTSLHIRGNSAFKERDYASALQCYSQALKVDPRSVLMLTNRAGTLANVGRFQESLVDADDALRIDPRSKRAHERRGTALLGLGRASECLAAYEKAGELPTAVNITRARSLAAGSASSTESSSPATSSRKDESAEKADTAEEEDRDDDGDDLFAVRRGFHRTGRPVSFFDGFFGGRMGRPQRRDERRANYYRNAGSTGSVIDIPDDAAFRRHLQNAGADDVVVCDMTAAWCGPSVQAGPQFAALASEFASARNCSFLKVDVDRCPEAASTMRIRAVPTFLVFKSGRQAVRVEGADVVTLRRRLAELMHR